MTALPLLQEAVSQVSDASGQWQAVRSVPLQVLAQVPTTVPPQAERDPVGGPTVATQEPAAVQCSHCPEQLPLQHTPSTQVRPEAHSVVALQLVPRTFFSAQVRGAP